MPGWHSVPDAARTPPGWPADRQSAPQVCLQTMLGVTSATLLMHIVFPLCARWGAARSAALLLKECDLNFVIAHYGTTVARHKRWRDTRLLLPCLRKYVELLHHSSKLLSLRRNSLL